MSCHHSRVILCHPVILMSFPSIPSINIMVCWVIFKNPPSHCHEWPWNDMGWFGMTFVPIPPEWQGWVWNDWTGPRMTGWEGPPKRPSSFPSRHSWSSPVIPAPAENAGTRGMGLEWLRMTRIGGPKFGTFPRNEIILVQVSEFSTLLQLFDQKSQLQNFSR